MKRWQYKILTTVGLLCLVLSAATVYMSRVNQNLQLRLQLQQAQINNGLLGPRGQQVSSGILQDMAASSRESQRMKELLEKHGYNVKGPAKATDSVTNQMEKASHATDDKSPAKR